MNSTARLQMRIVRDEAGWDAIASDWDRLHSELPDATLLQTFRFLHCWWQARPAELELFIVVTYQDDTISGILPLQRRTERIWGKRYRVLEFIGMPNELDRPDFLIPHNRADNLAMAIAGLLRQKQDWELLQLEEIVFQPGDWDLIRTACENHGVLMRKMPFHPCPWLNLAQTWPDYCAALSRKTRKNFRRARNQLNAAGELRLTTSVAPAEIAEALDTYVRIESQSWKHEDSVGVAANRPVYEALLDEYGRTGQARILILWLDDHPIAGTIALLDERCYYSMQITHDERYARFSPGTVLESLELEALMTEQALVRYEFMGGALANKRRWASGEIPTERLLIHRRDLRMWLFDWLYFRIKPWLRRAAGPRAPA